MPLKAKDRVVLRDLAARVAEVTARPVQRETISHWKALNGLRSVRPMVMIDEIPWHEMDVDGELALTTEDPDCRRLETGLRRTLYAWRHMRADMVVEPVVDVPKVLRGDGYGIETRESRAVTDPLSDIVGHGYADQLRDEADLAKIRAPEVELDGEATARAEEVAHEALDGILEVRMQGAFPEFAPWDRIVEWHGAQNVLLDLADRPGFMHRVIDRLADAYLARLDRLEEQGLLGHGQATIHCTGAWTDELPAPGFDAGHPRAKDLWTYGMAQILGSTSPAMHREFELEHAIKWYSRFGLGYYGCCEPLHHKMEMVRQIPNIRKVSMSPWVDVETGAEQVGGDYVFSYKPNPALLAAESWDPVAAETELRAVKAACARHGCPVELIMKDVSTVRYQPLRLWEWSEMAMRVAAG